jgi:Acetyl/propionyl-CoA carboxylase, alpha subunit
MKITVKIQDKTYTVQVGDLRARPIAVEVDGEPFEVWPEENTTAPVSRAQTPAAPAPAIIKSTNPQAAAASAGKAGSVTAPIPGVIVEIKVKAGDAVEFGQELCVLEAMKMKNSIRASHAGKVEKIHISAGEQVQQGKLLMELNQGASQP